MIRFDRLTKEYVTDGKVKTVVRDVTLTVPSAKSSTCCNTGSGPRLANTSPGNNNTGSRLTWAKPAAVTIFRAPGPMEDVTAIVRLRLSCLE